MDNAPDNEVSFLDDDGMAIEPILGDNEELSVGFEPDAQDNSMSIDELNIDDVDDSYGNTTNESLGLSDISMDMSDLSNASGGRRARRTRRRTRSRSGTKRRRQQRRRYTKKKGSKRRRPRSTRSHSTRSHSTRSRSARRQSRRRMVRGGGGACYGNGVGSNSYDPSFSVYNTRSLQLFPYKP